MRIGIFFGGYSREREISFAGGRTVYDNLNRDLFTGIPIFVDSFGNFVLLDWEYVYKGSIRDFYPASTDLPAHNDHFQIYADSLGDLSKEEQLDLIKEIGTPILPTDLHKHIDFAFLALHGNFGEDGMLQGMLESLNMPYSGSGVLPTAIGINKAFQKNMMQGGGFLTPKNWSIRKEEWLAAEDRKAIYQEAIAQVGLPFVSRPANQGSSIGVAMLMEDDFEKFEDSVDLGFFVRTISKESWVNEPNKRLLLQTLADFREGIGLPLRIQERVFYHPSDLWAFIDQHFKDGEEDLLLEGLHSEEEVIVEEFLHGKEFSCIVARNEDGQAVSLPPTEIRKGTEIFDYRSKYLPGLSSKVTPIELPDEQVIAIQEECIRLFEFFQFNVYARIDGFINEKGIFLNDPNTTSGMLPSSFFFHQAAEIGLNPSQFLSFIIRQSIYERQRKSFTPASLKYERLMNELDQKINDLKAKLSQKTKIGVVLGGYSAERHISVESGRNIYEKLASSDKYEPIPIFLTGNAESFELYQVPINILLKDNADDIAEKIHHYEKSSIVERSKAATLNIREKYAYQDALSQAKQISVAELAELVDGVFIALHGRPGEDGVLQGELEKYNIPYNGSGIVSSQITIDKYRANQQLKEAGFSISPQLIVFKDDWQADQAKALAQIEKDFTYPFIAKPVDDGCSAAVKKIDHQDELIAYAEMIFREGEDLVPELISRLDLMPKEEFPFKRRFLIEKLVEKEGGSYFLEVTGGLLTHHKDGKVIIEQFEPSETLKSQDILSLEEKFLAGEGQNITPARYVGDDAVWDREVAEKVKKELQRVAETLNIEGYARIDAFVRIFDNKEVEVIIIEINSLPGMTPATCIFHQCALNGYKPFQFIDKIIQYGFERNTVKFS